MVQKVERDFLGQGKIWKRFTVLVTRSRLLIWAMLVGLSNILRMMYRLGNTVHLRFFLLFDFFSGFVFMFEFYSIFFTTQNFSKVFPVWSPLVIQLNSFPPDDFSVSMLLYFSREEFYMSCHVFFKKHRTPTILITRHSTLWSLFERINQRPPSAFVNRYSNTTPLLH
eukprot:TRINITY_DN812_c0_g1_i13.p1 TRINITY_DN812_c0_g1~~TRINITY_DN812_c0_g1_i13.p1  ORF type:complete len:168 (+),score=19.72 TRINITY_DN812_c0_g1_i13:118-621(+)